MIHIVVLPLLILFFRASADIALAQEGLIPLSPVKIITRDNNGHTLRVPSKVFYDQNAGELFVISGGGGNRINIYDTEYYPNISMGGGRGIESPLVCI